MIDGIGSQPFSAITLPPVQPPSVSFKNMVIDSSRKLYAGNKAEVEKLVTELHAPERPIQNQNTKTQNDNRNQNQNHSQKNNHPVENRQPESKPKPSFDKQRENNSKPKQAEKTPDDLRNILSKMKESPNKVEVPNYKQPKIVETKKETRTTPQKQNFPKPEIKNNVAPDKTVDLKQALADVLKRAESEREKPKDLKLNQPENQTKQPEVNSKVEDVAKSQVRKIVVEHRQGKQDRSEEVSNINPADIKRMLRQSDNERSPFN